MQITFEQPTTASASDLPAIAGLLEVVFRKERSWRDELPWQYLANPMGPAWYVNARSDEGELVGHYAVIPLPPFQEARFQRYRTFLSLNTAVHPKAQGKGVFKAAASKLYAHLASLQPIVILGVANANSAHGLIHSLGFYDLGRMSLNFYLPWQRPPTGVERLLEAAPEYLRWRAGRPGARMVKDQAAGSLSRVVRHKGVPVEGVLSVGLDPGALAGVEVARRSVLPAAVRLYASSERQLRGGVPVPDRLRPSPLHYIALVLPDEKASALINHVHARRFEFLDFDVM